MSKTLFLTGPLMGVVQGDNASSGGASISGPVGILRNAADLETAKLAAQKAFCLLKNDRSNLRLLLRYVRTLRRCERLQNELRKQLHA